LNLYSYVVNNPLIYTDPTGMDCVYGISNGSGTGGDVNSGGVLYGDCFSDTDNGYYVDCDGCVYNASGAYLDQATGDLYFTNNGNQILDDNGNPTLIQGFADPTGTSTTVNVNGGSGVPPDGTRFSFSNMTMNQFTQMMRQSGFHLSIADMRLGNHPGIQMRNNANLCNVHVTNISGGNDGEPVTGEFHYDAVNPFTGNTAIDLVIVPAHGVLDYGPDLIQQHVWNGMPTGSSVFCH
jgi:hypothetical protein